MATLLMRRLLRLPLSIALWVAVMWASAAPAAAVDAYDWEPVREVAGFSIYIHVGDDDGRDELWAELPERIARIRADLGDSVLTGGEIHVLARLNDYWEERGLEGRAPRWAQALAMPARRVILLRVPDEDPVATLTHELSHLAVHEAAGGRHVPFWFLEGFAQLQAEELGLGRSLVVGMSALFGDGLSFDDLDTSFPPHDQTASLAYAQSLHYVDELLDTHGPERVRAWIRAIAEGQPWQEAFAGIFGESFARSTRDWRDGVKVWYAWVPVLVSATSVWTLIALLVLWGRRRVARRRSTRLATMEAAERELYHHDPDDDLFT